MDGLLEDADARELSEVLPSRLAIVAFDTRRGEGDGEGPSLSVDLISEVVRADGDTVIPRTELRLALGLAPTRDEREATPAELSFTPREGVAGDARALCCCCCTALTVRRCGVVGVGRWP